ncbi:hypothetical protein BAY61_31440 [Prauserella marina]|nr:hypothetical protein BAY61_31440 [Prauserella marina]
MTSTGDTTSTNDRNPASSSPNNNRTPQYHSELVVRSAERSPWNRNDAHQPSNPAIAKGTFATIAVDAATSTTRTAALTFLPPSLVKA